MSLFGTAVYSFLFWFGYILHLYGVSDGHLNQNAETIKGFVSLCNTVDVDNYVD